MKPFKTNSIEIVSLEVAKQLNCSQIEAVSKMQATCVRNGNEEMLSDLIEYKNILIESL